MSNFEYRLDTVKFDEFQRADIDKALGVVAQALTSANISVENPTEDKEKYRTLTRAQVSAIAGCDEVLEKLKSKYTRVAFVYEFKNAQEAVALAKAQVDRCEFGYSRLDSELKKVFSRESVLNTNMPFSELKAQQDRILEKFTVIEFDKVSSSDLFNEAIVGWFMDKTGFSFQAGQQVDLNHLKQVNAEVFVWLKNRIFSSFLSKNFSINIPDGREEWKCLVKKMDELGKKLNLQQGESCIFEVSLKDFVAGEKYAAPKFKFPEKIGQDFSPIGKFMVGKKDAVIETRKNNIKVILPLYIGLVKVKSAA